VENLVRALSESRRIVAGSAGFRGNVVVSWNGKGQCRAVQTIEVKVLVS